MAADHDDLSDVLQEFISESREGLDQCELALLELESDPSSSELVAQVFRVVHSIKGSAGFLDLPSTEALAHAAESWLADARDGKARFDRESVAVLLQTVDTLRKLLAAMVKDGTEGAVDTDTLVQKLATLARGQQAERAHARDEEAGPHDAMVLQGSDGRVRVDVNLLDRLMNLVGELVLARNQITQLTTTETNNSMAASSQRLSLVTTELQDVVMKTRMQPIRNVWSRFPRVTRDLAVSAGKNVRLRLEGSETELDRTIIEAIQDPLAHLVRNAIDHAIEPAEEREKRGKPPQGTLTLRAYHEGGMVNIEVSDDGTGIDVERVRARAAQRGIASAERLAQLSERDALSLIFLPGFSTAEQVTTLSGRGVGMDVVKTNVEQIGGTVDVQTRVGEGTTFKIKIPLTLAIVPALIVQCGGQSYAIAQASLVEVVRVEEGAAAQAIENVQGAPVLRLRGDLLPIAYLDRELGLTTEAGSEASVVVVVLQADERTFGLVVDDIGDTEEIVVKPLWKRLKAISCYAGATVMGDGRVALILDVLGLAQRIGVVADTRDLLHEHAVEAAPQSRQDLEAVLLCTLRGDSRLAIPLSQVSRLEELPLEVVERVGGADVAQYRGRILPLVHLSDALEERRSEPRHSEPARGPSVDHLQVVVYSHGTQSVGFVVEQILDVTEVEIELQRQNARAGIRGSMVVHQRITEFLDVQGVLRRIDPNLLAVATEGAAE